MKQYVDIEIEREVGNEEYEDFTVTVICSISAPEPDVGWTGDVSIDKIEDVTPTWGWGEDALWEAVIAKADEIKEKAWVQWQEGE